MVEPGGIISGFKITNSYKYILYIAGVILILSLFVDAQDFDNAKLRNISIVIIIAGIFLWWIDSFFHTISVAISEDKTVTADTFLLYVVTIKLGFIAIQIITWIVVFVKYIQPNI